MEENKNNNNNKKGLVFFILACCFTLAAILCCIYFGIMVKEHFELQATAENFEGLGSIGIIIAAIVFAMFSIVSTLVSTLFSILTIIKNNSKLKIIAIVMLGVNFLIIIANVVLFIVLKIG